MASPTPTGPAPSLPTPSEPGRLFRMCKEVSPRCPVEATVLGYEPNLGVNAFVAAGFAIASAVTLWFMVRKRTWAYSSFILAACLLETAGYGGRVAHHFNAWNQDAFQLQICAIVLAPTLLCISIYLTLKHVTLALAPGLSRLRPQLYPRIFVPADVSCLVLQAIGGGMAASGNQNRKIVDAGNNIIVAGICLQAAVLMVFGVVLFEYVRRVNKAVAAGRDEDLAPGGKAVWTDKKFRIFLWAILAAYTCILLRCIYRIAEMAGGWGNVIMQDEISFIVLESFLILIAALILACVPAGIFFPQMIAQSAVPFKERRRIRREEKEAKRNEKNAQHGTASGSEGP